MSKENLHYIMGTNMVAYVKSKGFIEEKVELTKDTNKLKYWFKPTDELFNAMREFKSNKEIQEFVRCQNEIKQMIITMRTANDEK